jgi:hypothetical protein
MKLPKQNFKLKVGPFEYEVKYSSDIAAEGECFGSTHNNDQNIFLDPNRKLQKIEQTFIHELLHACAFVNGLTYRWDEKDSVKHPDEEDMVREMSITLYQVIKDNPKIF